MPARWSVSALGGIAGLSAAQLHQTSGLYPHSTAGLLANWLVLLVLAASGLAGTAWLLYRQGRSWSVGSDPAQRPGLSRAAAPGGIDLGGGTFDVTVMDFAGDDLTVRATGGDAYLGGANFDKVLFDHFVEQFETAHGLDINDPEALSLEECTQVSQDWLLRATQVKHDLTARDHTTAALQAAGLTLRVKIRREEFLARARILLDEMTEKMLDVVAAAGVPPQDVSVVLAVGGSTRVPAVRERIQQIFGRSPDTSVRPDEAVALGAALFAAQRQIERGGALLLDPGVHDYLERLTVTDVAAHSLGVSAFAGSGWGERPVMATLLPRNTPLPITVERTFYTLRPGESQIVVPILEDESGDPELCRRVGTVIIDHLPAQRPAQQPVEVSMSLDRDGILQVSAADVTTGAKAHTTVMHAGRTDSGDNAADQAVRTLLVE